MIKEIIILSRSEMESIKNRLSSNNLVISINTPSAEEHLFKDFDFNDDFTENKLLTLFFPDIDMKTHNSFSDDMSERIVDFIGNWHERSARPYTLLIHCTAGISRSGACGRVISEWLGINREFEKNHPQIIPNVSVMLLLREKFGLIHYERG